MFCNFVKNSKWLPFFARKFFFENCHGYSAEIPCGSKILSKSLYLARFSRYKHFYVLQFCEKFENSKWLPFFARKFCYFHHCLNTLALTFISFSGRFVFAMQKHYLFFAIDPLVSILFSRAASCRAALVYNGLKSVYSKQCYSFDMYIYYLALAMYMIRCLLKHHI